LKTNAKPLNHSLPLQTIAKQSSFEFSVKNYIKLKDSLFLRDFLKSAGFSLDFIPELNLKF